ncbi:MAG: polysaccharide biosynthesis C-terminal domain-containing protein [Bacteroidota bacterium]|nr:polysaccharide biosynthesis C-terminal domain-containing protein [Bacteroidota bacterium]
MMSMKKLAKDTVIYGLSSIFGKFLNWCLVPLYTRQLGSTAEYGMVTNMYSWTALILVILTFGMETGFFRFANKSDKNPITVYSTSVLFIGALSLLFAGSSILLAPMLAAPLGYGNHTEYIFLLAIIVSIDAFSAIPFAYLRYKNRPIRFASIKMLFIILFIALNLFFLIFCPAIHKSHPEWISWFYRPDYGVGYILISNLIATAVMMLALIPELLGFKYVLDKSLLKELVKYSFPLLILGIAGIFNQVADKILFPFLIPDEKTAMEQLGVYGANFKIAVVMVMFTQAFRFAYEPFVFSKQKGADSKKLYADAMKYFIIASCLIYLGIMFYMDLLKYIIAPDYFEGLRVVPIVMIGQFLFGVYFNLSFWYKLTDETKYGAYFSVLACVLTILLNVLFVPKYGYIACAWASLISYLIITIMSYFIGQKHYPVQYDLKRIGLYTLITLGLYAAYMLVDLQSIPLNMAYRTLLISVFIYYMIKNDLPLDQIPLVNKLVKQ